MSDQTFDDAVEYGPEQLEQVLQENAYLRELLGQLEGIAHENIELLKRVAELEARAELQPAANGKAPMAASAKAAEQRAPATAAGDLASVVTSASQGEIPVLLVGPAKVEGDGWGLFSFGELTDICFGMPEKTALRYVSGPVTAQAAKDLEFLGKTYGLQSVQVDADGDEVDVKVWQQAVTALVESFRPRIVLMLNPDRKQAPLIPALSTLGAKVVVRCARNELNDLIGTDFRLPLSQQQEIIEAYAAASLVLASSHWEREQLDAISAQRIPTEIYVPGVDLNYFGDVARAANPFTRVLYVDDRSGPLGLKIFRDAANDLAGTQGISFEIMTSLPGRDTVNLIHKPLATRQQRKTVFAEADLLVVPIECGGFSQSLMEGLAAGCVCLTPEASFGRYPADSPFHIYRGRRGDLAEQINALHTNAVQRGELQARSRAFATSSLARNNWASWLRNCMTWLSA